ncbi:MAG: MMPL family transporter [Candidatus Hadarchaeales archaeon]
MSLFRKRSVLLLMLLVLVSALAVTSPWKPVDQNAMNAIGWPAEYTRGLRFGVDIIGGSRITLELKVSRVTFQINADNTVRAWREEIVPAIEDNLYVSVSTISFDEASGTAVAEIGSSVTAELLHDITGDLATVVSIERVASDETVNDVVSVLTARVDPYGTLGTSFTPLGSNLVLFEVAGLPVEQAKALLGKPGKLEVFMDENLLLRGGDIVSVGAPYASTQKQNAVELPFRLGDEGASRFSAAAAGKADYPTAIYVDRPFDSVILFDQSLLSMLHETEYDPEKMIFRGTSGSFAYPIMVTAVGSPTDSLSETAAEFLNSQVGLKTRIILLGNFSAEVRESLENRYTLENSQRKPGESVDSWIERVCNLKSVVVISPELASDLQEGKTVRDLTITITRASVGEAMEEARNLKIVLSERLPVEVDYVSETSIEPRLGSQFLKEALYAGIFALAGVFILIYVWYRRLLLSAAVMLTMISELVITLGMASLLNWSVGLSELGALIIVIGTGVDHQIIISNELLRGGAPEAGTPNLKWRVSRAFSVIFAAAATTAAAMAMLAVLGFGAMRGFALITITGTLIAVLITRPAFANIASAAILWQGKRAVRRKEERQGSGRPQERRASQ